ncbi:MAG TPA: YebC/PmpR family DNA-binding transcriptional regulator [Deltaproteobacteria bacterium]|nr:YebC/PmpR family DNA-binding transcriptional regulator [Deltaproteobacteria bacterium]
MSGHSKWATIKRKKGATDAKRGKIFSKLIKEITVAAKMGGGDPGGNPRLRTAIDAAKAENMPHDNIQRAIKRGTGELEGVTYEEITYEAYGPSGVAMMIQVLTDNKNRTVAEIRHMLSKGGGNMGESGSVGWVFQKKGTIVVDKQAASEETLMEAALEAGADDIQDSGSTFEITTEPAAFEAVVNALKAKSIATLSAAVGLVPQNYVKLTGDPAEKMLKLMENLEDHDDVQNVYANFDIPEEEMEKLS